MTWESRYPQAVQPDLTQIAEFIGSPLWSELIGFIETNYATEPSVEYSTCQGAPGWNVKYKKGGRALCTLYPREGFFICLICIGQKELNEAELLLTTCSSYTQELFHNAKPYNGTRWLMMDVTSSSVLEDVKRLLFTRAKPKQTKARS